MNINALSAVKVGSDICSVRRIMVVYEKYGTHFLDRILTETEKIYVLSKSPQGSPAKTHRLAEVLAGRFAAKEAVAKALGTGWRGIHWREVEITNALNGAPRVALHGRAKNLLTELGLNNIEISLSHEREFALAVALVY